jgi:hypothetical protein
MSVKIFPVTPMNASLGALGSHMRYASNLVGVAGSYRPLPTQTRGSNLALTGAPVNSLFAHRYPTSAGTANYTGDLSTVFAGTKTRLYSVTATAAADVSRAANYAQTVGDEPCSWDFATYGNDVWASNYVDEMQVRANNAGLFANGIVSAFRPQARFIANLRTSIIAANLESAGGTRFADEWAVSVPGNAASYDTAGGAVTQRSLEHPGQITGLVGGGFARLFKATSMSGIQFTGSSIAPWREDEISGSIGTPYGKSIVQTRDGEIAFWGGDGFYKQAGMSPPTRIGLQLGSELINHGVPTDAGHTGLNFWFPLKLVSYPTGMLTEDAVVHGVRCARTGIVMWFFEHEQAFAPLPAAKNHVVLWDPGSDLWSFGQVSRDVAAVASYPDLSADHLISGIVGMTWDGTTSNWFRFSGLETESAFLRWGAMPLELDGAEQPVTVEVQGIMPLFTWDVDMDHTSPPSELFVTVRTYDDPYLGGISGGQPRTEALRIGTNNNEGGWMHEPLQGSLVQLDLQIDPTDCRIPALHGVAVHYEVIG